MRRLGFTIIELMAVMTILTLIVGHILGVLSSQLTTYEGQKSAVAIQDDARLSADLILHDLRSAGFMMPPVAALSGVDGGSTSTDSLCVSDPTVLNEARVQAVTERFPGASLDSNLGGSSGTVVLKVGAQDVDQDGDDDFTVDAGIIIVEGSNTHCARILTVGSTTLTFTPSTPTVFAANTPNAVAVPAILYERTANGLSRNGLLISAQIEDFQIEFGVDANDDGQLPASEFFDGLHGQDTSLLRMVRLSVLTRSARPDPQFSGPGRQAIANRNASGTPDAFRRRFVTASASPRNLL